MTTPFNGSYTYPQHRITNSDNLRAGNATSAANQLNGARVQLKQHEDMGSPAVAATNNLLTSTAVSAGVATPMNATPSGGTLVAGVVTMDVPRGVQIASGGTDTTTVLVQGFDYYGAAMSELLTLNGATPVLGKKAFSQVASITPTATPAHNLILGTTSVLGLSYKIKVGSLPVGSKQVSGTYSADAGTVAYPDTTSPATSTTGDPRGTYTPAGTLNSSTTKFWVEYFTLGGPLNSDCYGVTPA